MATTTQIQVLYIAFFGRPADPDGLAYWANGVLGAKEELGQIADTFSQTREYLSTILGLTTEQIVDLFYRNMFGRFAEKEGQDFWVTAIKSGNLNLQDIGVNIGLSALDQDPPNTDTVTINAKAFAADKYTKALRSNPRAEALHDGVLGIEAGRQYLDKVIDFTTVPSDSEIDSLVNRIGGGSGAIGNQGGLVGGILNLSVYQDIIDNQSSRQIGVNGVIRQFPFALTHGNQSVVAVASDNAATNTLDALDSLVDASGKDLDLLTISVSGANNLQSATISNFETISFALNNYNGTLVSSTVGINPTGVDDFLVTGTLSLGNQVIIDGTNNNAERINASGTTAPHIRPVYEVPSWGATDALTSSFVLTADANGSALTGADGEDTLIGGAGDDTMTGGGGADLFIISEGANTILDFGVGGPFFEEIRISGGSALVNVTSNYNASNTNCIISSVANTALVFNVGDGIDFKATQPQNCVNGITINAATGNSASELFGSLFNDIINGNGGENNINGLDGNDQIFGLDGRDIINGGVGDDHIIGGAGRDTIDGGPGVDKLNFNHKGANYIGTHADDLSVGAGDIFKFWDTADMPLNGNVSKQHIQGTQTVLKNANIADTKNIFVVNSSVAQTVTEMDAVVDDIAAGAQVALGVTGSIWITGATGDTFNIWWVGDHTSVDPASNYLLLANTNIAFANSDRFTTAAFEVV